jgi:excisionase family DNA binding protein
MMDRLLTTQEAADRLSITPRLLLEHVKSGQIRYVLTGRGTKRPRRRFAEADLAEFIANRTRRDVPPVPKGGSCPSTSRRDDGATSMISSSVVVGFTARRAQRLAERQRP